MNITRYEPSTIYDEIHDGYGVVSPDGTRALRIEADDYGPTTALSCRTGYKGQNLAFNYREINDSTSPYRPSDSFGRKFSIEVTPPIADLDARQRAVAVYASALLGLENGEPLADIYTIAGAITVHLR